MQWNRRRQRGLALLMVLWASVLLAVLAAGVLKTSRTDVALTRNLIETTKAELAADSALWAALHQVLTDDEPGWRTDGSVYGWRIDGTDVRVRITDEAGRININVASQELLASLFEAAGESSAEADALSKSVVEFRNTLSAPFGLTESLEQVPGMPASLVTRVSDAITVYSGAPSPDASVAQGLALAALVGPVESDADLLLDAALDSSGDAPEILVPSEGRSLASSGLLRIQAESLRQGGPHFARDALIQLSGRANATYRVLQWRRGARRLFPISEE